MNENFGKNQNEAPFSLINYEAQIQISDNIQDYQKAKHAAKKLDPTPSPQDVLNNMSPPRDWKTPDNKYFMQYVSHSKASRDDVFTLKQNLEQALQYRQARRQGICSIRQQLFSQAFDQVIRQVTINCPERGLLLMRVKDQHKMTLAAYQTLYKSSVQFGMKKQLQSQQGMQQLQNQLKISQKHYKQFERKRIQLQCKKQSLEKRIQEIHLLESAQRQEQVQIISEQAKNLSAFLNSIRLQKEQKNKSTIPNQTPVVENKQTKNQE